MASYTYHPDNIAENGVDRMRFELGDTTVEGQALSCPLCDEEYAAILQLYPEWNHAKRACLRAIVAKLAYEVDTDVTGLSYSLSQRFDHWKTMLKELERQTAPSRPIVHTSALCSSQNQPYFYHDLHANLHGR